jgi:hypothetical protein
MMKPPNKLTFARRAHAYHVDGRRWSGASSWGKRIEDNTALAAWRAREAIRGVALDDQLRQAVLLADGRDELDDIVERALATAGANALRDRGTEMHRIIELVDLGRLPTMTDDMATVAARWRKALEVAGIELLDGHVERIVLVPELEVCGTFDRLARWQGTTVVLDLKTGSRRVKYPHSMAVQLALLARSSWITVGAGERSDDWTKITWTKFAPVADLGIDPSIGLIVALPSDSDEVEVHALDLDAGWDAATLAHRAKQWTASKPSTLVFTATIAPPPAIPVPDDPFEGIAYTPPPPMTARPVGERSLPAQRPAIRSIDEGPLVDEPSITAIRGRLDRAADHPAIRRWYGEAHRAGRSIALRDREWQSVRRFEIARAVLDLVTLDDDGDNLDAVARTIIGLVIGEEVQSAVTVGCALGSLTIDEARKLATLAALVAEGATLALHPTLDGGWGIVGDVAAVLAV